MRLPELAFSLPPDVGLHDVASFGRMARRLERIGHGSGTNSR